MSKARLRIKSGVFVVSVVAVAALFALGWVASSLTGRMATGETLQSAQPPMSGWTLETFLRKWAVKTVTPEFPSVLFANTSPASRWPWFISI